MTRIRTWIQAFRSMSPQGRSRLIWLGLSLLLVGIFLKVSWELHEDTDLDILDQRILIFIAQYRIAALNGSAVDVTALGSPTVITLMTVIGTVVMWLGKDRRGVAYFVSGNLGAGIATYVMKHLFTRNRPSIVPRLAS